MREYEKLTSEQEAEDFMRQMLELPLVQSARKIYLMCRNETSKDLFIRIPKWLEWCIKYRDILLPLGADLVRLIKANASDEELQRCIDDFLAGRR